MLHDANLIDTGGLCIELSTTSSPNMLMNNYINKCGMRLGLLMAAIFCLFIFIPKNARSASASEQLIVFVQPDISPLAKAFQQNQFPQIGKLAQTLGVDLHVVDACKGSPLSVGVTPLIVYQNHRGRSIYQGRTTTLERIRNFIRTSRFVPQGKAPNRRENIPVWQEGRSRIWAPLKVAAVTGTPPKDYNHDIFVAQALENIVKGFKKFRIQKKVDLGRADRGFYLDFNPWRSRDGTLYLSLVLFSQFDCKTPVFQKKMTGPWADYRKLFQESAAVMENTIARIIKDPESGDSFDPVGINTPQKSWKSIGFPLPPAPKGKTAALNVSAEIPQHWILATSGPDDPPMIQFRFPAPLDNYSGEVTSAKGEFSLSEDLKLDSADGMIEIDTRTAITMGDPMLDEAIQGSMLLYTKKFPTARFDVEKITGDGLPLVYGRLSPAAVSGTFTLKGKDVPLNAKMEFEPIIGEDGKPRLLIRGAFTIDLRVFNIEGADGPAPARHMLILDLNFILKERRTRA
jgi:polyisoprenoid-binding protein YceI